MNWQYQLEKRGEEFMKQGKYDLAIQNFTRSLRIDSVEADCLHLRGKAYLAIGEFELAITDFTACIDRLGDFDVDDAYPISYEGREKAYRLKGDLAHAAEDLEKVNRLKQIPRTAEEFFERGKKYLDQGKFELALYDFDNAIDRGYITAAYHEYRAKAYQALGEFDLAKNDLDKARKIELSPPIREPRNFHERTSEELNHEIEKLTRKIEEEHEFWDYANRGYLYMKKRDYNRAISDFTICIEMTDDTTYYCDRGETYLARGDFDLAIEDFSYVIDVFEVSYEEFLESHEGRAKAYQSIGKFDLAAKDLKRVDEIHRAAERLDQFFKKYREH
ncbi:MAG: tetratricopeptide repeat protein [Selenomonadaceae bacterium]|nr:tetratricopeptide repeat protein [Selenomonadaceae bacterium]